MFLAAILVASVCSAQTLDEIVKKYSAANGTENLERATTITVEGNVIQMGTEMPITIMVKRPDKLKVVITFSGMEIITLFDGEKGYMVNPLTGSAEPMEIPADQLSGIQEYNMFLDPFLEAYKAQRVVLEGEEAVDGKPAFKVTIKDENGNITTSFIDKESFLTVKSSQVVSQMGREMEVESFVKEYMEVNGIKFSKVINQIVNGMDLGGMTFDKIEIDKEIADSVFKID